MIFASILLGNSFIFTLFTWADCTDEILFSDVIAIIIYVSKMHFLKYVEVIILFLFYTVHVDQVWLLNVPICPSPCPNDHSNLIIASAAPPLSSHQGQEV